jgi:hypothetical protein
MSRVRRLFTSLIVCAALGQPALAQQAPSAEALEAARAFIEASGSSRQFDQVIPLIAAPMTQSFILLAPQRAKEIHEVMAELVKRFTVRKGELIDQFAVVYAQRISVEDMREITKFYQSGAGRRMVDAQPEIIRESIIIAQRWGQSIGAEIDAEMRRELKKRGIDL